MCVCVCICDCACVCDLMTPGQQRRPMKLRGYVRRSVRQASSRGHDVSSAQPIGATWWSCECGCPAVVACAFWFRQCPAATMESHVCVFVSHTLWCVVVPKAVRGHKCVFGVTISRRTRVRACIALCMFVLRMFRSGQGLRDLCPGKRTSYLADVSMLGGLHSMSR